jgi:hypothetical protein
MKISGLLTILAIVGLSPAGMAITYRVPNGTTSLSVYPTVRDSGGTVAWDYNDAPTLSNYTYYYTAGDGNALSSVGEVTTLANYNSAFSAGGAKASGKGGVLRFCVPDACCRVGAGAKTTISVIDANGLDRIEKITLELYAGDPNSLTTPQVSIARGAGHAAGAIPIDDIFLSTSLVSTADIPTAEEIMEDPNAPKQLGYTAARAGYLDNLNVGSNVAQADQFPDMNSASKWRLLLNASGGEVANEPNQKIGRAHV